MREILSTLFVARRLCARRLGRHLGVWPMTTVWVHCETGDLITLKIQAGYVEGFDGIDLMAWSLSPMFFAYMADFECAGFL